MSHINSHREPRRSKIRDHRRPPSRDDFFDRFYYSYGKKGYVRVRRQAERQAWAHLKDFRCVGGLECDCIGCEATELTSQRQLKIPIPKTGWNRFNNFTPPDRCLNDWEIAQVEETLGRLDLSGADLRGERIWGPAFRGADLRGADLRGADLTGADLRGADLRGANLKGADLRGKDLRGANLRGADLTGVNPRWIPVKYWVHPMVAWADLTGTDLRGANLRGANLKGADLTGAEANEHTKGRFLFLVAAGVVFED
jgi:hypothetical protein